MLLNEISRDQFLRYVQELKRKRKLHSMMEYGERNEGIIDRNAELAAIWGAYSAEKRNLSA